MPSGERKAGVTEEGASGWLVWGAVSRSGLELKEKALGEGPDTQVLSRKEETMDSESSLVQLLY